MICFYIKSGKNLKKKKCNKKRQTRVFIGIVDRSLWRLVLGDQPGNRGEKGRKDEDKRRIKY